MVPGPDWVPVSSYCRLYKLRPWNVSPEPWDPLFSLTHTRRTRGRRGEEGGQKKSREEGYV